MVDTAPRKLLLAALCISGAALAFLIGARAGASLDKVMTDKVMFQAGQTSAAVFTR